MNKGTRRLSQGSSLVASYIRDLVVKDVRQDPVLGLPYLEVLSENSLALPVRLGAEGPDLEEDPFLTDRRAALSLQESRLLNWAPGIKKLVPLAVSNDGNTLCHSASLALWGIHDRSLDLRHLVSQALQSEAGQEFRRRWQSDILTSPHRMQGLAFHHDMEAEWQVMIELASETNKSVRSLNPIYEPLEELHIFVLANVLRRPIIIFADRPIRSIEQEAIMSSFSAIYLPLLWPSQRCYKSPLVFGYCDNYFSPLLTFGTVLEDASMSEPCPEVVPLVSEDHSPIETRYLLPEEESNREALHKEYLILAEIEASKSGKITHVLSAAKLILNPLTESQQLISEFFRLRKPKEIVSDASKTIPQLKRRVSRFKCGNKTCDKLIDNDHLFPYCSECYPKFQTSLPKASPSRRKMNSANTVVAPTSLEIECATVECPYYAAVNCFPYCQRCHTAQKQHTTSEGIGNSLQMKAEKALEQNWQKLAMGVVDEELVSGIKGLNRNPTPIPNEVVFANLHRQTPLEDGEKCGFGGVTSTRSQPIDQSKQNKVSVTGARSGPQRRVSREELELATNSVNVDDDWKRKVSWINEPCIRTGCSYFASTRTYPYCNQCTQDASQAPRNRKVSGTCSLSTLIQED